MLLKLYGTEDLSEVPSETMKKAKCILRLQHLEIEMS